MVITSLSVVARPDLMRGFSGDRTDSLSLSEAEKGGGVTHEQKQKKGKEVKRVVKGKDQLAPPSSEADEIKKEVSANCHIAVFGVLFQENFQGMKFPPLCPHLVQIQPPLLCLSLSQPPPVWTSFMDDSSQFSLQMEAEEAEEEEEAHQERSEAEEIDPAQFALPTFLTAGTIFGSVIRVDLTKVRVDVETNDLSEFGLGDGPFKYDVRTEGLPNFVDEQY